MSLEAGIIVRVIRDFLTTAEGELCINAGEYLQVLDRVDRHWVICRSGSRQGSIPTSHVTEVEGIGKLPPEAKVFVVVNDFQAEQQDDLSLRRGMLVIAMAKVDDNWYRGRTLSGLQGIFPPSYCWELDASAYIESTAKARNAVEKYAQVVHSMKAQLPEEIDLNEGDVIKITEILDKDWYRGECNGKSGTFPSSFVRIIDSFPGDRPPASADLKAYQDANKHRGNEYMNTRQAFSGLEDGLRCMGQRAKLQSVLGNGILPDVVSDGMTKTLLEDEYFRQNLPSSYGSVSLSPPADSPGAEGDDAAHSVYGHETQRCSKGFQDLSEHLSELGQRARYQNDCSFLSSSKDSSGLNCDPSSRSYKSEPPSLECYNRLSESLNVFKSEKSNEESSNVFNQKQLDYTKLSENLKVFEKSEDSGPSDTNALPTQELGDLPSGLDDFTSQFRYQNVTQESLGYTDNSVDVRPYAITRYNFVAQFDNELGFKAGEMVYLNRYVDNEWLEAQIDDHKGLVPISYVNVIVDCKSNEDVKNTAVTVHDNLLPNTYHKVLYNFQAQMEGDVTVAEGEVVLIKEKQNEDWIVVENWSGESGVMPGNHVDPQPEFDGQALFDIERLLSYRSHKDRLTEMMSQQKRKDENTAASVSRDELKFFDPLRSPDGEMMQMAQELEEKARQPKIIPMPDNSVVIKNCRKRRGEENRFPRESLTKPRDIESLINTNLAKLKTSSPGTSSNPFRIAATDRRSDKINISRMVLQELRGKNVRDPESPKRERKSPAPQRPKPPSAVALGKRGGHQKGKSQKPRPPAPPIPPPPLKVPGQIEPLYSKVNKDGKDKASAAPPRPSKPPMLVHSVSLPTAAEHNDEAEIYESLESVANSTDKRVEVEAEVHVNPQYDTPNDEDVSSETADSGQLEDEGNANATTPTNDQACLANVEDSNVTPTPELPERTTSMASERKKAFPPDRNGPLSPTALSDASVSGRPPKPTSWPYRSASVASSVKSRSVFYASIPSERGYSPAMSSLHHSYETLNNVGESSEEHSEARDLQDRRRADAEQEQLDMGGDDGDAEPMIAQRRPHRPAPPVPVNEQFHRSKQILFNNPRAITERRYPINKRHLRHRKIHSLKRQIQIKEKMLEELSISSAPKEQLLRELDMYQEIAVAKGALYEHLNRKMDHCQDDIEALSDEIQRLQASLAEEELKLDEEWAEESRRKAREESINRQMNVQETERLRKLHEEKLKRNKEQRENVIAELIQTEVEFCRDLRLTWQAFALDTPEMLEQRAIDVVTLFGNLREVIDVSEKFQVSLQADVRDKACPAEQMVGKCFLEHAEVMKKAYTEYCVNNDKAEQLLEKYEQIAEIQKVLQKGVETIQSQVTCFNIGSILIKPVQRILKYPLMLNELIKCTEDDHRDKGDLVKAVGIMSDVAAFINESKRRKDIVDKYKTIEDKTLTRKFSKLSMHSINKKSSRMSQKFLSTIGIDPMTRDYDFDDLERRFSFLSRSVQLLAVDSQRFRDALHDVAISQFNTAENIVELYKERANIRESNSELQNLLPQNLMLESRVVKPLLQLLDTFQGPARLIQKRQDKHLDYSASKQRSEKNRDPTKGKSFREDMEQCRTQYEALNSQLVEELPKLLEICTKMFSQCVTEFILLRKLFVGRVTKELLSLMDLPLLSSTNGDILEVFMVKHSLVCTQLGRFSFTSKTFKPEEKKKQQVSSQNGGHTLGQASASPQTPALRTFLRGKYAAVKLYQANENFIPREPLEIGIEAGDLVGVIQHKDPMGNDQRWFVDNGSAQGFVPCRMLIPIGQLGVERRVPTIHEYDDVAEEDAEETEVADGRGDDEDGAENNLEGGTGDSEDVNGKVVTVPVRKAPPVPAPQAEGETIAPPAGDDQDDVGEATQGSLQEEQRVAAGSESAPGRQEKSEKERRSSNGYEEIPPSEGASEPSQDLSPIYEEIKGAGSRSTVSSSSSSSNASNGPRGKFHFSLYDFAATESTMLSLSRGQVVRVTEVGSGEWWYVEDRNGNRGYVPHSYLKIYPTNATKD